MPSDGIVLATKFTGALDSEGFPPAPAWNSIPMILFNTDWQGKNPDSHRETEVGLLWTPETLFLRFRCRFRTITVFPDAEPSGRRDHLWDRDVAEVFLQPDLSVPRRYFEFEASPNGFWIDLDIRPNEKLDPHSGMKCRVRQSDAQKLWFAQLAIPMRSLAPSFDPASSWRVNFFRVEGASEPRFYSSWRPTNTPEPNFHVPAAFGHLAFR
jgi:alpha-galactosidase